MIQDWEGIADSTFFVSLLQVFWTGIREEETLIKMMASKSMFLSHEKRNCLSADKKS